MAPEFIRHAEKARLKGELDQRGRATHGDLLKMYEQLQSIEPDIGMNPKDCRNQHICEAFTHMPERHSNNKKVEILIDQIKHFIKNTWPDHCDQTLPGKDWSGLKMSLFLAARTGEKIPIGSTRIKEILGLIARPIRNDD